MPTRVLTLVCAFCLVSLGTSLAWEAPTTAAEEPSSFVYHFPHVTADFCGPFLDRFDDTAPGWYTGSFDGLQAEIIDGEYRLAFAGGGTVWLIPGPVCLRSSYRAAVDARWAGTTGNFIGLLFGIDDSAKHAYLFAVNTDERVWLVFEIRNDGLDLIIPPTGHDAVLPGASINRLVAERIGDTIVLSVNQTQVGELRDAQPGAPVLAGVAAAGYTFQSTVDARFDNFLWQAESKD
ncbi:MAG TPA: hypothetical protein PKE20_08685 [Promineifilum sp.]|nr:hypothetical protein [Promineifilum sp.]